jgi:hypothetical protein
MDLRNASIVLVILFSSMAFLVAPIAGIKTSIGIFISDFKLVEKRTE